jgi:hypothetical protein
VSGEELDQRLEHRTVLHEVAVALALIWGGRPHRIAARDKRFSFEHLPKDVVNPRCGRHWLDTRSGLDEAAELEVVEELLEGSAIRHPAITAGPSVGLISFVIEPRTYHQYRCGQCPCARQRLTTFFFVFDDVEHIGEADGVGFCQSSLWSMNWIPPAGPPACGCQPFDIASPAAAVVEKRSIGAHHPMFNRDANRP